MLHLPVYLDYSATTPVDPRVVEKMVPFLHDRFGNPASRSHAYGWDAEAAVEAAREEVARLVNCDAKEIVWTSGATESINLALKGAAQFYKERGRHLVTVKTEHKATLDTMRELERQGFEVTYLDVREDGLLDLAQFEAALKPGTILASVMFVNNEIGVIQDVAALGEMCRARGVIFHVDSAQATGKLPIDVSTLPIDLMSLTAHKTHGPKGIGALYVRRQPRVHLQALIHGGGHEHGLRSGTLATHQIVGMGEAFRIAAAELAQDSAHARVLHQRLLDGLQALGGVHLNGHATQRVPHNLNLAFDGVSGEDLMLAAPELAVSSGSACSSGSQQPSHVLRALCLGDERAHASLRISFGRFTTPDEVDRALQALREALTRLRAHAGGAAMVTPPQGAPVA